MVSALSTRLFVPLLLPLPLRASCCARCNVDEIWSGCGRRSLSLSRPLAAAHKRGAGAPGRMLRCLLCCCRPVVACMGMGKCAGWGRRPVADVAAAACIAYKRAWVLRFGACNCNLAPLACCCKACVPAGMGRRLLLQLLLALGHGCFAAGVTFGGDVGSRVGGGREGNGQGPWADARRHGGMGEAGGSRGLGGLDCEYWSVVDLSPGVVEGGSCI